MGKKTQRRILMDAILSRFNEVPSQSREQILLEALKRINDMDLFQITKDIGAEFEDDEVRS